MKHRFNLKGWGPILSAALLGFVLGTSGVSVLWPHMWEGAKLSDSLGFWGGILGGLMTLVAAIIAFRPARDQMLIARHASVSAEIGELEQMLGRLSDIVSSLNKHLFLISAPLLPNYNTHHHMQDLIMDAALETRKSEVYISCHELFVRANQVSSASYKFSSQHKLQHHIGNFRNKSLDYYAENVASCMQNTREHYQYHINNVVNSTNSFHDIIDEVSSEIRKTIQQKDRQRGGIISKVGNN